MWRSAFIMSLYDIAEKSKLVSCRGHLLEKLKGADS
jgi:hypothetical protein